MSGCRVCFAAIGSHGASFVCLQLKAALGWTDRASIRGCPVGGDVSRQARLLAWLGWAAGQSGGPGIRRSGAVLHPVWLRAWPSLRRAWGGGIRRLCWFHDRPLRPRLPGLSDGTGGDRPAILARHRLPGDDERRRHAANRRAHDAPASRADAILGALVGLPVELSRLVAVGRNLFLRLVSTGRRRGRAPVGATDGGGVAGGLPAGRDRSGAGRIQHGLARLGRKRAGPTAGHLRDGDVHPAPAPAGVPGRGAAGAAVRAGLAAPPAGGTGGAVRACRAGHDLDTAPSRHAGQQRRPDAVVRHPDPRGRRGTRLAGAVAGMACSGPVGGGQLRRLYPALRHPARHGAGQRGAPILSGRRRVGPLSRGDAGGVAVDLPHRGAAGADPDPVGLHPYPPPILPGPVAAQLAPVR